MTARAVLAVVGLLAWSSAGATAARLEAADDRLSPSLEHRTLRVSDGLPRDVVTAIAQDDRGFIWLGTPDGLARYDGQRVVVLGAGLLDPYITALAAGSRDELWVGTARGGLYRLDTATGQATAIGPERLAQRTITALAHGMRQDLWVGTPHGLFHLDSASSNFRPLLHDPKDASTLVSDVVTSLLVEEDSLWVGTAEGLDRLILAGEGVEHYSRQLISRSAVTSIARDERNGDLWVGSPFGLQRLGLNRSVQIVDHDPKDPWSLPSDKVRALRTDASGRLWVATDDNGVAVRDPTTGRFIRDLAGQPLSTLFPDREGGMWIGALGGGALIVPPLQFRHYRGEPGKSGAIHLDGVNDVYKQGATLWIGAARSSPGLFAFDADTGRLQVLRSDPEDVSTLSSDEVWRVLRQGDRLWLGTSKGLNALDLASRKVSRIALTKGAEQPVVSALALDRRGGVWVASLELGLGRYDPVTGAFRQYPLGSEEGANAVFFLLTDQEGDYIWAGTSAGVARVEVQTGKTVRFRHDPARADSLGHDEVSSMVQEPSGALWISTLGGGLNRLDPHTGRVTRYSVEQGLASKTVNCVARDVNGALWVATPHGLSHLDPAKGRFIDFDVSSGVPSGEWADGGCSYDPQSDEMYFGSAEGFVTFNPKRVQLNPRVGRAVVTGLSLMGTPVPLTRIPSAFSYLSVLSVDFSVLSFHTPLAVQYMLEGVHDGWMDAGPQRSITFSRLPPGDYRFRVRSLRGGVAQPGNETSSVAFRIAPPPWRTWWAQTAYALLGISAAAFYLRYQRNRVRALKDKLRLAEAEHNLELAGIAQTWFLPKTPHVELAHITVSALYRPADKCGGDWWWYARPGETNSLLCVGDVTGHSAGATVLTASVATAFRAFSHRDAGNDGVELLGRLDREIAHTAGGEYQMTMSLLEIGDGGRVQIFFAGGLPAFWVKRERQCTLLHKRGTPLGSFQGAVEENVGRVNVELGKGDRLFLFTDGVVEMQTSAARGDLGMKGLLKVVMDCQSVDLKLTIEGIRSELDRLRVGKQEDDVTLVAVEWKG